ncbi:hypothetical protein B0T10DRAFT_580223 [Thelonectria olida]|uniref:C2H2-type domain-containing protein n=1 Tax=Thelonectria olida TaxID=1576542 RepID=A0A9P9ALY6_9HYPO|nr:hypothetical protein B0T10DRAFT_580223 [Thelonectria olida]
MHTQRQGGCSAAFTTQLPYLGAKETQLPGHLWSAEADTKDIHSTTSTLSEFFFDPSLLLSPHVLLLGLLFRYKAFRSPSLTTPEYLDKLEIHPDENELPLPLKESLNDIFVFRDTIKTAFDGFAMSVNKPLTYGEDGELAGFSMTVILYSFRYNATNEFDQCPNVSDGLRNLMLQHTNSDPFRQKYLGRVVSVDTLAIVRHARQQKALMRQACSIGYSFSKRRPTDLTPEQAASVNKDPRIQKLVEQRQSFRQAGRKSLKIAQKLEKVRTDWSPEQAIIDIERQLAGQTFEEATPPPPYDGDVHPAQIRLIEALTATVTETVEDERRRRNNVILAVMAYCPIQESSLPRGSGRMPAEVTKLGTAIASVFVMAKADRTRRCFFCVGRATTLAPSDPAIERLIKPFYSPGDLSKHFKRHHLSNLRGDEELSCRLCKLSLDHKRHLQNHAETVHGTVSRGG